jgi:hypothetical protein
VGDAGAYGYLLEGCVKAGWAKIQRIMVDKNENA